MKISLKKDILKSFKKCQIMSESKSLEDYSTPKKIKMERQSSNEISNSNEILSPGKNDELAPCMDTDTLLNSEQIKSETSKVKF